MFAESRTVFRLFGIDIRIDPSWLLIAALITWSFARHVFPAALPAASGQTHVVMGVIGMLLFFASLVAHELAHALVARRLGVGTRAITLFMFGGIAELAKEPAAPRDEFRIALAGPVMSLALAVGFWLAAGLSDQGAVGVVMSHLALLNMVLAIFNLLPAFPLDGGRVLRAWLWNRSSDLLDATERAATTGAVLAYVLIGFGCLALFQGGVIGGLWQILIGIFLLAAARSAVVTQQTRTHLGGRTARDLMTAPPITTHPETTLATLVNQIMLRHRISFVPVVEGDVLLGHITTELLAGIDRENWANTQVDDVFVSLDPALCVAPDTPAISLIERMTTSGQRKLMVVSDRHLIGVVTLSDTLRILGLLTSLGPERSSARKAA